MADSNSRNPVVAVLANWLAYRAPTTNYGVNEYPLFTDAHLVDDNRERLGPYSLINTIAGGHCAPDQPAAVLRIASCLPAAMPNMDRTDVTNYHGGQIQDEIAALLGLELGIRLKAGPIQRRFELGQDPRGEPTVAFSRFSPTPVLRTGPKAIIGSIAGKRNISDLPRLETLLKLSPSKIAILVKAARLYQEAVWICDSDPDRTWLLLVSAVEAAANEWRSASVTDVELVRSQLPELAAIILEQGGDELLGRVAGHISNSLQSTRKFVDFLSIYLPSPPIYRTADKWGEIDWSPDSLKKGFKQIYNYRSRALHDGTPFPHPMSSEPSQNGSALAERPVGLATSGNGGVWVADDLPMLLWTFHYIARGALLNWWDSLYVGSDSQ